MSDYQGTYTTNLNLSKDSVDDSYDVERVNSNSDKIDKWAGEVNTSLKEIVKPNLLINRDFQVWQRGESFSNVDGKYTADRWLANNSISSALQIAKVSNGLKMSWSKVATGIISQTLEDVDKNRLVGKKVSCAISVDGVRYTYTTTIATKLTYIDFNLSTKTFATNEQGENTKYFIYLGQSNAPIGTKYIINYVDVFIGETIGNFVPRLYGEELALCRRYGIGFKNERPRFRADAVNGNQLIFFIPLTTMLRISPTTTDCFTINSLNGSEIEGFTFTVVNCPNGIIVNANKTSHGMSDGQLMIKDNAFIDSEIY